MDVLDIPFVKKVGIQKNFDGQLELADNTDVQNHLQTIHAGAQFLLAETASGDFLQSVFPDLADKIIPVLRDSQIKFKRPATNIIQAYPKLSDESQSKFLEQFANKGRATISVDVEIKDMQGTVTCTGTFGWFIQRINNPPDD